MISQTEMVQLVTRILDDADLSQFNGRIVREKVTEALGERAGNDPRALKRSIRDAIATVLSTKLTSSAQKEHEGNLSSGVPAEEKEVDEKQADLSAKHAVLMREHTVEKGEGDMPISEDADENGERDALAAKDAEERNGGNAPVKVDAIERSGGDATAEEVPDKKCDEDVPGVPNVTQAEEPGDEVDAETKDIGDEIDDDADYVPFDDRDIAAEPWTQLRSEEAAAKVESDQDADDKEEKEDVYCSEQRISRKKGKKRRLEVMAEDEEDENTNDEPSSSLNANNNLRVARNKNGKGRKPDQSGANVEPVKRKRSSSSGLKTENHLEKLRSICKQLGCPVPPMRLRNKSVSEKCAAVLEYLYGKGVHVPNPTLLTRKEIQKHRSRLEREKELAGLDTRFVGLPHYVCEFSAQLNKILIELHLRLSANRVKHAGSMRLLLGTHTDTLLFLSISLCSCFVLHHRVLQ